MRKKSNRRYCDNWVDIALEVKQKSDWTCAICKLKCIKPSDDVSKLSRSQRGMYTLNVHHANYCPEDNSPTNLIAVCSGCHLNFHTRKRGNITPGQMSFIKELGFS